MMTVYIKYRSLDGYTSSTEVFVSGGPRRKGGGVRQCCELVILVVSFQNTCKLPWLKISLLALSRDKVYHSLLYIQTPGNFQKIPLRIL